MDDLSMAHAMSCKISLQTGLKENFVDHHPLALYKNLAPTAQLHINQPKPIAKCGRPSRGARTTSVDADTAKRRSLVNFNELNSIMRLEIFLHRDGQLQAMHVILGFKPISTCFQVSKHMIKAKDSCLARVDVVVEGFIRKPPHTETQLTELPNPQVAQPLAVGEEIISSDDEAKAQSEEVKEEAKEESFEILV
nr:hypothetical protein CFP56_43190 [Quercus suber]